MYWIISSTSDSRTALSSLSTMTERTVVWFHRRVKYLHPGSTLILCSLCTDLAANASFERRSPTSFKTIRTHLEGQYTLGYQGYEALTVSEGSWGSIHSRKGHARTLVGERNVGVEGVVGDFKSGKY